MLGKNAKLLKPNEANLPKHLETTNLGNLSLNPPCTKADVTEIRQANLLLFLSLSHIAWNFFLQFLGGIAAVVAVLVYIMS